MIIDELPFFFQSNLKSDNGGYPFSFPFRIFFDERFSMYRQESTDKLQFLLKKVYELGSLVDGSISNEAGSLYIKKTCDYIQKIFPNLKNKKILEIGCGNGVIIKSLSSTRANLIGLEPGNHKKLDGVNIIRDFFPSKLITGKFDLILHFLVLEHLVDPVDFLISQKKSLKTNGKIIFAVPNCEPFFETGDISIFIHEHFNYFTRENIKNVVKETGLFIHDLCIIEGLIFVCLSQYKNDEIKYVGKYSIDKHKFENKISFLNNKIIELFNKYREVEIAIYAPSRALNTLFVAKKSNCRLIDDNSEVHGKYLPGLNKSIESFEQLTETPPKCILIYSRTFGVRIKEKCIKHIELKNTVVLTLDDLEKQ